jgi:hypothetical protein
MMHFSLACACLPTFKATASNKILTRQANDLCCSGFLLISNFSIFFWPGKRPGKARFASSKLRKSDSRMERGY